METLRIEILNPKAKSLLKDLADLKLIRIEKDKNKVKSEFRELLNKMRKDAENAPSFEEISREVEEVRKVRHEK